MDALVPQTAAQLAICTGNLQSMIYEWASMGLWDR